LLAELGVSLIIIYPMPFNIGAIKPPSQGFAGSSMVDSIREEYVTLWNIEIGTNECVKL